MTSNELIDKSIEKNSEFNKLKDELDKVWSLIHSRELFLLEIINNLIIFYWFKYKKYIYNSFNSNYLRNYK